MSTIQRSGGVWTLAPGDRIRRVHLHNLYGGTRQSGICPSATTNNVLIFTDPESGEQHGYSDTWGGDGVFRYTGEGRDGDQTLTKGNRAIANHQSEGRALRVFRGARGVVEYVGEFCVAEHQPFEWAEARGTSSPALRKVIVFNLVPADPAS